jgi:UDP-2,3-diacylglucosamine pyrophosphatase LpxH
MKKIKLVISDLHLGRGRRLPTGQTNQLEEFYFDNKLIEFLQYYTSGEFKDHEVELVINGDFLNFLQVDFRGHFLTVLTEDVCLSILKSIVDGHQEVFRALRQFAAREHGYVTYVVGNHDQAMLWPSTRAYLNEVIGAPVRYKNIVYFFDGVHVEHGHMHEAANRLDPKKFFLKKDLAEPILNLPFGSHFFIEYVLRVKQAHPHVDKVRPFGRMIRWSLANETWFTIVHLIKLLGYLVQAVFVKDPRRQYSLKRILKIVLESAIFPDLSEAARRILMDERVHTVVFGHSHVYQYRQWADSMEYFNTGTWTELTSLDISAFGKITKLTYVLFEYDETGRPRGRLKEWRGFHRIEEDVAVS